MGIAAIMPMFQFDKYFITLYNVLMRIKNILSIPLVIILAFTSALGFSYAKPKVNSNQVLAPMPSGDPFFRAQRLADSAKPGTILEVKDGVSMAYPIGKVKQIPFVSTNTFGKKYVQLQL